MKHFSHHQIIYNQGKYIFISRQAYVQYLLLYFPSSISACHIHIVPSSLSHLLNLSNPVQLRSWSSLMPIILWKHSHRLPIFTPIRIRPPRLSWPSLLHQWRSHVSRKLRILQSPRHRLRLSGSHSPRASHVNMRQNRAGSSWKWVRGGAVAAALHESNSRQRVHAHRMLRRVTFVPRFSREELALSKRFGDELWRILRVPGLGHVGPQACRPIIFVLWVRPTGMLCGNVWDD